MSRKANQDKAEWRMPSLHVFNGDYGPFKPKDCRPIEGALVWLHDSGAGDGGGGNADCGGNPLRRLAGEAQQALLGPDAASGRVACVVSVDVADMFATRDERDAMLADEMGDAELCKGCGRKLAKVFQRLLLTNAIVAAEGELCGLLLKLYMALEGQHETSGSIKEVWLIRPKISAEYVNAHLVAAGAGSSPPPTQKREGGAQKRNGAKRKNGGARQKTKGGRASGGAATPKSYPAELHLVTAAGADPTDCRASVLRHYFPSGGEVALEGEAANNRLAVVASAGTDAESTPEPYRPDHCDEETGKSLFASRMVVEMNPLSKQYERRCEDAVSDLLRVAAAPPAAAEAGDAIDWSTCDQLVGALVLRGNRCILVRSLEKEWEGMRIPFVYAEPNESPHDAAVRAVEEFAEVEPDQVRPIPGVLPIPAYGPGGYPVVVEIYPLLAAEPPPPGPLENADMEDEDDCYDWYTYPNATKRLDGPSRSALRTAAFALLQAAEAGLVPSRWGGIFGQELTGKLG